MFHGYHATEVMAEHRRRVRDVTERAYLLHDAIGRAARTPRTWWRRRVVAPGVEPAARAHLAATTR
jgi:hypothetical protein